MATIGERYAVPTTRTTATQGLSEPALNQINLHMRQQPWYTQWFSQRGLNPNRVKLNERQRQELASVAAQHGFALGSRMKFDEAGNINQQGGFAGMPGWAKVAIAAAPVAGSMLIPGVREAVVGNLGSIFTGGGAPLSSGVPIDAAWLSAAGGGVPAAAGGAAALPAVGAAGIAGIGGAAALPAAAGIGFKDILMGSLNPAIGTIGGIVANRAQAGAARDVAEASVASANYAADIQSKSAAEQLAFLREQEAQRRKEFEQTQTLNRELYDDEQGYLRGLEARRYANLAPYRNFGAGSVGALGRPIRNIRQGGR